MGTSVVAEPTTVQRGLVRPLRIGLSVGHFSGACGSIGPFVRGPNDNVGFISTATALAPQKVRPGDYIHQPSPVDIALTGETRAATLSRWIARPDQVDPVSKATLDAAVAWLIPDAGQDGNVVPPNCPGAGSRIQKQVRDPAPGDTVAMAGRTTGYAEGRVTAIRIDGLMVRSAHGTSEFSGCIEVEGSVGAFSQAGDTGALVWRLSDGAPLGIVFASVLMATGTEAPLTYVLPLAPILERFQVSLL